MSVDDDFNKKVAEKVKNVKTTEEFAKLLSDVLVGIKTLNVSASDIEEFLSAFAHNSIFREFSTYDEHIEALEILNQMQSSMHYLIAYILRVCRACDEININNVKKSSLEENLKEEAEAENLLKKMLLQGKKQMKKDLDESVDENTKNDQSGHSMLKNAINMLNQNADNFLNKDESENIDGEEEGQKNLSKKSKKVKKATKKPSKKRTPRNKKDQEE